MATAKQVQIIHILKQKIGLDNETYRQILGEFNVDSSTKLTAGQAKALINRLNCKSRHESGCFATDKQVYVIRMKWQGLSRKETAEEKDKALIALIKKKYGKTQIYDLTRKEASELLRIFKNWGGKK